MSSPTVKAEGIVVPDLGSAPPQGYPMHQDANKVRHRYFSTVFFFLYIGNRDATNDYF